MLPSVWRGQSRWPTFAFPCSHLFAWYDEVVRGRRAGPLWLCLHIGQGWGRKGHGVSPVRGSRRSGRGWLDCGSCFDGCRLLFRGWFGGLLRGKQWGCWRGKRRGGIGCCCWAQGGGWQDALKLIPSQLVAVAPQQASRARRHL